MAITVRLRLCRKVALYPLDSLKEARAGHLNRMGKAAGIESDEILIG